IVSPTLREPSVNRMAATPIFPKYLITSPIFFSSISFLLSLPHHPFSVTESPLPFLCPSMEPHGLSPWSLQKNTLLRQGFGGLSASGEIRRSSDTSVHDWHRPRPPLHPPP